MNENERLTTFEKAVIFLTAPVVIVHVFWAAMNFEKGGKRKRDEHYRWLQYGILFYMVALFIGVFLMNKFKCMP